MQAFVVMHEYSAQDANYLEKNYYEHGMQYAV